MIRSNCCRSIKVFSRDAGSEPGTDASATSISWMTPSIHHRAGVTPNLARVSRTSLAAVTFVACSCAARSARRAAC